MENKNVIVIKEFLGIELGTELKYNKESNRYEYFATMEDIGPIGNSQRTYEVSLAVESVKANLDVYFTYAPSDDTEDLIKANEEQLRDLIELNTELVDLISDIKSDLNELRAKRKK